MTRPSDCEMPGNTRPVQRVEGPCWSELKTVKLGDCVSERLLQAMLLPNATGSNLNVTLKCKTFDHFAREDEHSRKPRDSGHPFHAGLTYQADAMPILGPSYFAAAKLSSIRILGYYDLNAVEEMRRADVPLQELCLDNEDFEIQYEFRAAGSGFPALRKLGLVATYNPSIDQWCDWLMKCPLLTHVVFKGMMPSSLNMIYMDRQCDLDNLYNLQAAAGRLGMTLKREPDLNVHCFLWCEISIVRP